MLSEVMPEPTLCGLYITNCHWYVGVRLCCAGLTDPRGGLALEGCLVLSYLVTMTMYELAATLLRFLIAGFQTAFALLAVSCVRPELVRATVCARRPASCMDCLNPLSHSASHVSLPNPLGIFFFKDLYTGLLPNDRIDNMKL